MLINTPDTYPIKTAIISVSDKTGIVDFAKELSQLGVTIFSTGGTSRLLLQNNIPVKNISELTNFEEILDGRVKTLHHSVHAGLLADLSNAEHLEVMKKHNFTPVDLVVVNLYPFEENLKQLGNLDASCDISSNLIENIDIGGPTMLRAAAKNYKWTTVIVDPNHYNTVLESLRNNNNSIPLGFRKLLAGEVFNHTAHYDSIIANYFNIANNIEFPKTLTISYNKAQDCRYGENPHQNAAIYGDFMSHLKWLCGKELSYNNIMDISAICDLINEFDKPTVAIVKHTNPCGVGSAENLVDAYRLAFSTDETSPYGGIIATNGEIDEHFATAIHSLFSEIIIGKNFTENALKILTQKKNRRLICADYNAIKIASKYMFRSVSSGMLYQKHDNTLHDALYFPTERKPDNAELEKMLFAWKVVKHVKSNAIVFADNNRTLGIGAGQMSRVDSARIAVEKAKMSNLELKGVAMASDAYLPFADALLEAVNAGVSCVIQPGGSIRDEEVIQAANKHNIAMCFTGQRHFKH